jgi:V8-like Glu-specific endopeptidase
MRSVPGLRWLAKPSARIAGTSVLAILAIVIASPADGETSGLMARIASAARLAPAPSHQSKPFAGTPAVGALFPVANGALGRHFCTASVVHSPHGNLLVTAAHCVAGHQGTIAFVPGYDHGKSPYGVWYMSQIFVDQDWSSSSSQDDDVAFAEVGADELGTEIEDITGSEQLGLDQRAGQLTRVIGYPNDTGSPVVCDNRTTAFSATQLEFDCGGYPGGTSGGPFLAQVNQTTGQGTVTGVIGGYEQGGDTPSVSYSVAFGNAVGALYRTAVAAAGQGAAG